MRIPLADSFGFPHLLCTLRTGHPEELFLLDRSRIPSPQITIARHAAERARATRPERTGRRHDEGGGKTHGAWGRFSFLERLTQRIVYKPAKCSLGQISRKKHDGRNNFDVAYRGDRFLAAISDLIGSKAAAAGGRCDG